MNPGLVLMPLDQVLRDYRPGSRDHDWQAESDELWERDYDQCVDLLGAILVSWDVPGGIWIGTPVMLGRDGRVWDGHHRLVVLRFMAYLRWVADDFLVPVVFGEEGPV